MSRARTAATAATVAAAAIVAPPWVEAMIGHGHQHDEHGRDMLAPCPADVHDTMEAVEDHARGVRTLTATDEAHALALGIAVPAFGSDPSFRLFPAPSHEQPSKHATTTTKAEPAAGRGRRQPTNHPWTGRPRVAERSSSSADAREFAPDDEPERDPFPDELDAPDTIGRALALDLTDTIHAYAYQEDHA